jgi:hypothetical protein
VVARALVGRQAGPFPWGVFVAGLAGVAVWVVTFLYPGLTALALDPWETNRTGSRVESRVLMARSLRVSVYPVDRPEGAVGGGQEAVDLAAVQMSVRDAVCPAVAALVQHRV